MNTNDPRLTAYVLGELDEQERSRVEAEVLQSEELQKEVAAIRETIEMLRRELGSEPAPALNPESRRAVEAAAGRSSRFNRLILPFGLAAAAGLMGLLLVPAWLDQPAEKEMAAAVLPSSAPAGAPEMPRVGDSRMRAIETEPRPPDSAEKSAPPAAVAGPSTPSDASPPADAGQERLIAGVVTDATGSPLPGVEMRARSAESGKVVSTLTDDQGRYKLSALPGGDLEVEAGLAGFQKFRRDVGAEEAGRLEVSPTLQIGEVAESIIVTNGEARLQDGAAPAEADLFEVRARTEAVAGLVTANRNAAPAAPPPSAGPARMMYSKAVPADRPASLDDPRIQPPRPDREFNTEAYDRIEDNPFIKVSQDPLSTFSIDVDTASYANVRRFLDDGALPPKDAVRIEELINYFPYDYPAPSGSHPFSVSVAAASAPWKPEHRLLRIGLKGRDIQAESRPSSNLVFLLDVSGSMEPPNKLPLLKQAFKLLVERLTEKDRVAIVVYAGASGLVLPPTGGDRKEEILQAIERLQAGGSTNGGAGISLAYDTAMTHLVRGGINRVILATDGDFNVGVTNQGDLIRLIEERAARGVFLSVLGFGMGNYKDSTLEKLADRGNGNYAYIDSINEARKVLVEEMGGTLVTIAKDVKIQVEFNPSRVGAYRLIGYENRILRHQDFNDDRKDAGEIGAGHTVTALYEVVPAGVPIDVPGVDPLKYQKPAAPPSGSPSAEMLTVKLRYKQPEGQTSQLLEVPFVDRGDTIEKAPQDFRFAAAVAGFGMLLRESPYRGNAGFDQVENLAESGRGEDRSGYRAEFIRLVKRARALMALKATDSPR